MLKQPQFVGIIALFMVLSLAACQANSVFEDTATPLPVQVEPLPLTTDNINLIELADLDQTKQIKVMRRLAGSDCTSTECEELFVLSDQEIIQDMIDALDEELDLQPRTGWPASYTLIFQLRDGRQCEIDFVSEMGTPSFFRGGQSFWQEQDVVTPDAFNRLFAAQLAEAEKQEAPFRE
jgi:hypothetical protein